MKKRETLLNGGLPTVPYQLPATCDNNDYEEDKDTNDLLNAWYHNDYAITFPMVLSLLPCFPNSNGPPQNTLDIAFHNHASTQKNQKTCIC